MYAFSRLLICIVYKIDNGTRRYVICSLIPWTNLKIYWNQYGSLVDLCYLSIHTPDRSSHGVLLYNDACAIWCECHMKIWKVDCSSPSVASWCVVSHKTRHFSIFVLVHKYTCKVWFRLSSGRSLSAMHWCPIQREFMIFIRLAPQKPGIK